MSQTDQIRIDAKQLRAEIVGRWAISVGLMTALLAWICWLVLA